MANFSYHKITKTKKIRYISKIYKNTPFVVFLHGFMSNLEGDKPNAFLNFTKKNKLSFLAFRIFWTWKIIREIYKWKY
tara:strand:+ start:71 stop:304 length:234 start_codon:yes stop_codon:yes gene_type:complete